MIGSYPILFKYWKGNQADSLLK